MNARAGFIDKPAIERRINLKRYGGALGDGSNADAAMALCLAANPTDLVIPEGTYELNNRHDLPNAMNVSGYGATITQTARSVTFYIGTHKRCRIAGLLFAGNEDFAGLGTDTPTSVDNECIRAEGGADDLTVTDCHATGRRALVGAHNCDRLKVSGWSLTGFMPAFDATFPTGANFCTGVFVNGGKQHTVEAGTVNDHGSAVLVGSIARRVLISGISGENLRDNGVYISSGEWCTVTGAQFKDVQSTGVKMRGSYHSAIGGGVENALVGVSLTGFGTPAADLTGKDHIVQSITIDSCRQRGIECLGEDTGPGIGYLDGVTIEGNTVRNTPATAIAHQSITVQSVGAVSIQNNQVFDCQGTGAAVIVQGTAATPLYDLEFSGNRCNDATDNPFYFRYLEGGTVSNNSGRGNGQRLIEGRELEAVSFDGNECSDQQVIGFFDAQNVANCSVSNNKGVLYMANTVKNENAWLGGNQNTRYQSMPDTTAAPLVIGSYAYTGIGAAGRLFIGNHLIDATGWSQVTA